MKLENQKVNIMTTERESTITLTASELLNFASHHVTQENLNETRKELDGKIESVRNELSAEIKAVRNDLSADIKAVRNDLSADIQAVRNDLSADIQAVRSEVQAVRNDLSSDINNMFYKLVFFMLAMVGGIFGGIVYILNNFYHLQP